MYVIAELGQGYEGSPFLAKMLLEGAGHAGANAAKFQLIYSDELATNDYEHYELFKSLEMADDDWINISLLAKSLGINLIFDIFGEKSLSIAIECCSSSVKIHPTDISNYKLLNCVAKSLVDEVIVGVGGSHLSEIESAVKILKNKNIILMHGFQGYPTEINENQLSRIKIFKQKFKDSVKYGFADHFPSSSSCSLSVPYYALGLGYEYIEKHLTVAKSFGYEDSESAFNVDEFEEFVKSIKKLNDAYGNANMTEDFGMTNAEEKYRTVVRRHVVASKRIMPMETINSDSVVLKRTGTNNPIESISKVVGKTAIRTILENQPILLSDLE